MRNTVLTAAAFLLLFRGVMAAQCPDGSQGSGASCRPAVPIDTQAVVVLPFTVNGPRDVAYLAGAMADLFSMVDGLGGYRVIHPSVVQRKLGDTPLPPSFATAATLVRSVGARYALGGSVVVLGQNIRTNAELYDVVRGRRVTQLTAQSTADRLDKTVDSLVVVLVARGPLRVPGAAPRSGEFTTGNPSALRAYLAGEQLARSAAWRAAADSFQSSIRQDSAFGWAWLSLGRIVGNTRIPPIPGLLAAEARHRSRFTDRVQRIRTIATTFRVDRAKALATVDQLAAQYPYDPEIAYLQGDVYYHVGRELGRSQHDVRMRIERALELDGDRPETIDHYAPMLGEIGDTAGAFAAVRRARIAAPNDVNMVAWDQAMRAVFRGEDPVAIQLREGRTQADYFTLRLLPRDPARAIAIADSFARPLHPDSAASDPIAPLVRRYHYVLSQGRYVLAKALLDSLNVRAPTAAGLPRRILHALITGSHREDAASVYRSLLARADSLPLAWLAVVGWYATTAESPDSAEHAIAALARRSPTHIGPAIATGLRGLLALRGGDTAQARRLLAKAHETHTREAALPSHLFPSITFALTLARIELAAGNAKAARLYLHDAYPPHEVVQHMPHAEELLGQVSEALGDFAAAREAYGNVVKLLANADPQMIPMRTAAQAALQRLSTRP